MPLLDELRAHASATGRSQNSLDPETGESAFKGSHGRESAAAMSTMSSSPRRSAGVALAGALVVIVPTALRAEWTVVSRQLIPTRAFENGVFLAYANYAGSAFGLDYLGDSRIVGPDGRDLACAGAEETLISARLDLTRIPAVRSRLPYLSDLTGG